jgi:uncharacterized membrane protein YkvA (DUF1232 family)
MFRIEHWKQRIRELERGSRALYLAARDPRVPWYAKVLVVLVVAYAVSPIDLIPDFIPVLGYLDDLLLVPLGIALAVRLIPAEVWRDCVARAEAQQAGRGPRRWTAAVVVVSTWLVVLGVIAGVILW